MLKIPKDVFKKTINIPNVRDTSNYSVFEDVAQNPYAMSPIEVLQSCPLQQDALLESIGSMEYASLMAKFNHSHVKPCLPYHVAFSIDVDHGEKTIGQIVIVESAYTCVRSISCWKALRCRELVLSNNLFPARMVSFHSLK